MSAPPLPPVGTATTSDHCTPSQETTVSTLLTTDSSSVDFSVDNGGGEDAQLLPLTSIFHCPLIKDCVNNQNGKMSWLCKWCGKTFSLRHQSQAIQHLLKIKLGDIAICSSLIPKEYKDRYHVLYVRSTEQMATKKHLHTQIDDALAMNHTLAIANLLGKHGVVVSSGTTSSPSMSIHSFPLVQSSIPTMVGAGKS